MVNPQMVMYEEEFNQIQSVVDHLVKSANAKSVFIVDKNGQLIAASGETDNLDTTSLASLIAGTIAAMGGMAKLLKENEFPTQFHEADATPMRNGSASGLRNKPWYDAPLPLRAAPVRAINTVRGKRMFQMMKVNLSSPTPRRIFHISAGEIKTEPMARLSTKAIRRKRREERKGFFMV